MRSPFDPQLRLGATAISDIPLNTRCRDEIIPILTALKHIYGQPTLRDEILDAVAQDVNACSSPDRGRPGMDYWPILVLAAVRLGCNLNYDKLQNLAEEHRTLRAMMGVDGWDRDNNFDWRLLHDNISLVSPDTIEWINHRIVAEGHRLVPTAAETVRGDSFVLKTNIHYPTDSSLIGDGLRIIVRTAVRLANLLGVSGWRQHHHLMMLVKRHILVINRTAKSKGHNSKTRLQEAYRTLLDEADRILARALNLLEPERISIVPSAFEKQVTRLRVKLLDDLNRTIQVCDVARRRVLKGETIENGEKLFSLFEPETQLINRGKAPHPIEFGHRVLVVEDGAGFVCHYAILPHGVEDRAVAVETMKQVQDRLHGQVRSASFDRGFHTPENQIALTELVLHPCLPKPGHRQAEQQEREATVEFREARRRHAGVESAIGALQSGNGLDRCRDHSFGGYSRYVGLGILGRNLHVLGKILIAREDKTSVAGQSKRGRVAA